MKKLILKIVLITSILFIGCTDKKNIANEIVTEQNNSNGNLTLFPIPASCDDKMNPQKIPIKEDKGLTYYMTVAVCKINNNLIEYIQIDTIVNLKISEKPLDSIETHEKIPYYKCNTEEAQKAKKDRVSICKRDDGFSELVIRN